MSDLDKISSVFNAKIDTVKTKEDLQNIKIGIYFLKLEIYIKLFWSKLK